MLRVSGLGTTNLKLAGLSIFGSRAQGPIVLGPIEDYTEIHKLRFLVVTFGDKLLGANRIETLR